MSTLEKLLQHFGLTPLPFDRAVPPEGLLRWPEIARLSRAGGKLGADQAGLLE